MSDEGPVKPQSLVGVVGTLVSRLIFLIALAAPTVSFALDAGKSLTQYRHNTWTTDQGLPQNSVVSIVQTRDGYLWMGSELGLVRFDGSHFENFNQANTPALRSNYIYALLEDKQGSLWAGTGGGLTRYRNGEFRTFRKKDGLSSDVVLSLFEDHFGAIWIGTEGGGLDRLQNGHFDVYTAHNGLASDAVYAIAEDTQGNVWAGTHDGLSRFNKGSFIRYGVKDGLANDYVRTLAADRDGSLWVGTNGGGLSRIHDGVIQTYSTKNGLPSNAIWALKQEANGTLWIGTVGGGLSRMVGQTFTTFDKKDGLSSNDVLSLMTDREGSIWIGTGGGGLNQLADAKFTPWGTREGMSSEVALGVLEDSRGNLWVGTNGGGVNRFREGKFEPITTRQGLADNLVFSLAEDQEGAIWFGTHKRLNRLKDGKLRLFTQRDGAPGSGALVIYPDRQGNIWVGTRGGLSRFRNGTFQTFTTRDGLSNNSVMSVLQDHSGDLWIGTAGGLNRFHDGRFQPFGEKDGLAASRIATLYEDKAGVLWLGSLGGGLTRMKGGQFKAFTSKIGLPDDSVFQILEDSSERFWMSSNLGIFRVSKKELDAVADGESSRLNATLFGTDDGMKSKECNGNFQPAAWKSRDGKLWFPTMKGIVSVDPAHPGPDFPPPVALLERSHIDGKELHAGTHNFKAPPGTGQLEFRYSALNFNTPEQTVFKYKLEGFDATWVSAGKRRVAYYTNIPPGKYRFHVMAQNGRGAWSTNDASADFSLSPHFFQTYWFYALCLVSVGVFAASLPILRVRQMKATERMLSQRVSERTEELRREISERERVEGDLLQARAAEQASRIETEFLANISHEIRTPINGIRGLVELTLAGDLQAEQRTNIATVRDCTEVLLVVVNDILDFSKIAAGKMQLDPTDFDLREIVQTTVRAVEFQAHQKGLAVVCEIDPAIPELLRGDFTRVRQIVLNLLNNSVKFTEKGEIALRVKLADRSAGNVAVYFEVTDTGIGISENKQKVIFEAFSQAEHSMTRRFGGTGLGLTISSRLVRLMGGDLCVNSIESEGSRFYFTVRLEAAQAPVKVTDPLNSAIKTLQTVPNPLHVLVVEDSLVNQRVAVMLLKKRGHTTAIANNGREALEILQRHDFDVILMDIQMPEMDGFEATTAIRLDEESTGKHVPIVGLTAHAMESYKKRCLEIGMDRYLSKPIVSEQLFETIESLAANAGNTSAILMGSTGQ
jgi:ligand-binding sensor domain-containing protein/signal transduction histidine kinase/CheY-like chemotaxis protein